MTFQKVPLETLCEAVVDCPHSTPKWTDQGVIVLRNQNIRGGRLDLSNPSFTDKEHYKLRTKRVVPRSGDLVFTREAPMGEVCQIPKGVKCCLGQRQVLLRVNSENDARFVLYAIQSPIVQHEIGWNEGTGSTVSNVRIPVLKSLEIPCPSFPVQKAIADVLGSLDDKIELNRQTARTLEELSQRLFKSWFVDFDPVRAKMAGSQPAHMPPETAALFPDKLVDSPLGPIPEGWEIIELGGVVKINPESYSAKDLPDVIHYIDISSAGDGECAGVTSMPCDEAPSRARRIAKAGDTVWSMVRPNRRAHFFYDGEFFESTVISTGFGVIRPSSAPCFFYFLTDQSIFYSATIILAG